MSSMSRRVFATSWFFLLVDRSPLRFLCMCPLAVAVDGGRYFSSDGTSPGKDSNWLSLTALRSVVAGGENNDWW